MSSPLLVAHHMGEDVLVWAAPAAASALPLVVVIARSRLARLGAMVGKAKSSGRKRPAPKSG